MLLNNSKYRLSVQKQLEGIKRDFCQLLRIYLSCQCVCNTLEENWFLSGKMWFFSLLLFKIKDGFLFMKTLLINARLLFKPYWPLSKGGNFTKYLKNQPCDVIKIMDYPSLFGGVFFPTSNLIFLIFMADFWDTL